MKLLCPILVCALALLYCSSCNEDDDVMTPPVITTDTTIILPDPVCPDHDSLVVPVPLKTTLYSNLDTLGMDLNLFKMVTDQVGYMAGSQYNSSIIETPILKTNDGGRSWKVLQTHSQRFPIAMHFANEEVGFIRFAFDDNVLKTTNGGTDWETLESKELRWLVYADEQICYSIVQAEETEGSYLLQSVDLGNSWDTLLFSTVLTQGGFVRNDGLLIDNDIIYTTGSDGKILKITPEGILIEQIETAQSSIRNLIIVDENTLFIESRERLLKTIDRGKNWEIIYPERNQIIDFFSATEGIIARNSSTCTYAHDEDFLTYTSDSGENWEDSEETMTNLVNQSIAKHQLSDKRYLLLFYNKLYLLEAE